MERYSQIIMLLINFTVAIYFVKWTDNGAQIESKVMRERQQNTNLPAGIGTASHPDMQKIRINVLLFENRQHCQFEAWLLLFAICTVPVSKPFHNT